MRLLQKTIAKEITTLVHGKEEYLKAIEVSQILFGDATGEAIQNLDSETFLELFEGVPQAEISRLQLNKGLEIIAALASETGFLSSNGEARRALNENAISVNQAKVDKNYILEFKDLIADKYILLRRGKKTYFILKVET